MTDPQDTKPAQLSFWRRLGRALSQLAEAVETSELELIDRRLRALEQDKRES